jgi:hypothetical protein
VGSAERRASCPSGKYSTTRSEKDPLLNARPLGVYVRANPEAA